MLINLGDKTLVKEAFISGICIILAIFLGSLAGISIPSIDFIGGYIDYLILLLIFLVFIDIPIQKIILVIKEPKILLIAWITNFLILPFLGFGLTKIFLSDQPLLAIGLCVYFMAPCTDWFLGFTKMAHGNTALGSVLLPINMITQLLFYPILLYWFGDYAVVGSNVSEIVSTLVSWFLVPITLAFIIRGVLSKIPVVHSQLSKMINWVMYALVFSIFSVNIHKIIENYRVFLLVLISVLTFFLITSILTESISRLVKLCKKDHVLYTMTTTARNAPLMLGLTMTAIPDQPLIYAVIVIGMLIEFPFLVFQVLRFDAFREDKDTNNLGNETSKLASIS